MEGSEDCLYLNVFTKGKGKYSSGRVWKILIDFRNAAVIRLLRPEFKFPAKIEMAFVSR